MSQVITSRFVRPRSWARAMMKAFWLAEFETEVMRAFG